MAGAGEHQARRQRGDRGAEPHEPVVVLLKYAAMLQEHDDVQHAENRRGDRQQFHGAEA